MNKSSVTMRYTQVETPIGRLLVAATLRGVVRIDLHGREAVFRRDLERRSGAVPVRDDRGLAGVRRALQAYLAGRTTELDFPADLTELPSFHRQVLETLRQVPRGTVVSYGELARRVGKPGAARAVGRAMGTNPLPILYPCHRVVAQDGSLGGFGGGLPMKRALLELEGALLPLSLPRTARRPRAPRLPGRPQARPTARRTSSRA